MGTGNSKLGKRKIKKRRRKKKSKEISVPIGSFNLQREEKKKS